MGIYAQNKAFFNQPIRLEKEEMANPDLVIEAFRNAHHLHEIRQYLWDLLETAITTENTAFQDASSRNHILFFYQELESLIEAIYMKNQYAG
jgi:hypothetical protein